MSFQATNKSLFFSRHDTHDPRLGDLVQVPPPSETSDDLNDSLEEAMAAFSDQKKHYVIAGYPDHEGIELNGGRLGAAHAPDAVRLPLYKMTPFLLNRKDEFVLWDIGNLNTSELSLEMRHQTVTDFSQTALNLGASWIGIGGGHDYGFPDAAAFIEWCRKSKSVRPLIINFDAHLDVRPMDKGLSSGTPFFRMLEAYPDVDFAEIGIQGHCNSRAHFEWAKAKGAKILTMEEVEASHESFSDHVIRLLGDWLIRPRPVFLSIDIDGFSSDVAPGCSQSWATGFTPADFFPCLQILKTRLDVKSLGIYEVSPPLDQDNRTAKLAAQIIHRVIS